MKALSASLANSKAPVRLRVVDATTPAGAAARFAKGDVELALVRADTGDLAKARTVVTMTYAAMLILTPGSSGISDIAQLKGKTVGVLGMDANKRMLDAVVNEYELDHAKTTFKDIAFADVRDAIRNRHIQALIVVTPMTARYIGFLRNFFGNFAQAKVQLLGVDAAGAIADVDHAYESWDLPKGSLRGSPALPDDDLTTLRVPYYLVAQPSLSDAVVNDLAKSIMTARRGLVGEYPILAQIASPSTDKDAYIPIHPGAAAYYDGDDTSFMDKYGDYFWYASAVMGGLTSILAAAWKFMSDDPVKIKSSLERMRSLMEDVATAGSDDELDQIEDLLDTLLKEEASRRSSGDDSATEPSALHVLTSRLQYLIARKRIALAKAAIAS